MTQQFTIATVSLSEIPLTLLSTYNLKTDLIDGSNFSYFQIIRLTKFENKKLEKIFQFRSTLNFNKMFGFSNIFVTF